MHINTQDVLDFQIPMVGVDACSFGKFYLRSLELTRSDSLQVVTSRQRRTVSWWMQLPAFTPFYGNHNIIHAIPREHSHLFFFSLVSFRVASCFIVSSCPFSRDTNEVRSCSHAHEDRLVAKSVFLTFPVGQRRKSFKHRHCRQIAHYCRIGCVVSESFVECTECRTNSTLCTSIEGLPPVWALFHEFPDEPKLLDPRCNDS